MEENKLLTTTVPIEAKEKPIGGVVRNWFRTWDAIQEYQIDAQTTGQRDQLEAIRSKENDEVVVGKLLLFENVAVMAYVLAKVYQNIMANTFNVVDRHTTISNYFIDTDLTTLSQLNDPILVGIIVALGVVAATKNTLNIIDARKSLKLATDELKTLDIESPNSDLPENAGGNG